MKGMNYDEFVQDEKTSSAVIRKIEILGEASKNIPEFIKERYPHVPWKEMAGMRNRLTYRFQPLSNHSVVPRQISHISKQCPQKNTWPAQRLCGKTKILQ